MITRTVKFFKTDPEANLKKACVYKKRSQT